MTDTTAICRCQSLSATTASSLGSPFSWVMCPLTKWLLFPGSTSSVRPLIFHLKLLVFHLIAALCNTAASLAMRFGGDKPAFSSSSTMSGEDSNKARATATPGSPFAYTSLNVYLS